jgi:predicted Zn finger-like uncharacterized protein
MHVQCPNCGVAGQIADWKIPKEGGFTRCLKCQTRFFVRADLRTRRDRRSGVDRRKASYSIEDDFPYFFNGGSERRSWGERRLKIERRAKSPRMNKWSIAGGGLVSRNF